jgi:hypothetical protein
MSTNYLGVFKTTQIAVAYGQTLKVINLPFLLFVCFLVVTAHCGCIFHSPVAGFSLLVFEVS